jgi:hypothetical protein
LLRGKTVIGELLFDTIGIGIRQINLINRHDNRHISRTGMGDGF